MSCTGAVTATDDAPGTTTPNSAALPGPSVAATSRLRRLTVDEYDRTMLLLLGDAPKAGAVLPEDNRKLFDNDFKYQAEPDSALIGNIETLASDVAARLIADTARRDALLGCTPKTAAGADAADCLRQFITRFARLAWHRSLTDEQVTTLLTLGKTLAQEDNDFYSGVDAVVRAILQDSELLFRVEVGTPVSGSPGLFKLTGPEMAARLSFFLWGSIPDVRLLDLAEHGGLDTTTKVRAEAAQMLSQPAALARIARFHALWMGYERMPGSPLAAAMKLETDSLMSRVIFEKKLPWQDLFRSQETYVPYDLAVHYGLTPPSTLSKGGSQAEWILYAGTKRQGLLSHASFLSLAGTGAEKLMTIRRGKAIRERLFCEDLPPKPAVVVNRALPPPTPCKPDSLKAHSQSTACSFCHTLMDPVGFGLDNYDGLGKYRDSQNWRFEYLDKDGMKTTKDKAVVTTGEAVPAGETGGVPCTISGDGDLNGTKFNGPAELASLVLASPSLNGCAVTQVYRFAMGRTDFDDMDKQFLDLMAKRVGASDFRFDQLLLDFVSSGAFGHVRVEN